MSPLLNFIQRTWLWILLLLLGVGIVLYIIGGYLIYDTLTQVDPECTVPYLVDKQDNTPAAFNTALDSLDFVVDDTPYRMPDYETITFLSRGDDIQLSGWFVPSPTNSDASVIVVHGLRSCRKDSTVLLPAGMLSNAGFNVLLFDMRNHGDSQIVDGRTAAGNREFRDVLGAYDWLREERGLPADSIGVLGMSLGGGASLIAFGQESEIAAVWVDSAFADINDTLADELARNNLPSILLIGAEIIAQISGVDLLEYNPLEAVSAHNGRPVFITHSTSDQRLRVDFAYDLYDAAGPNATLWVVDGYRHVEAVYNIPDEYEARLIAFFTQALGDPMATAHFESYLTNHPDRSDF